MPLEPAKRRRLALSANRSNRRGLFDFRDKRALGGWIGKLDHGLIPVMAFWEDADTKSRKSQVWIAFSLEPRGLACPRVEGAANARHGWLCVRGGARGRMDIIKKYAFVLVLILAVIYVYAPPTLEDVATLPWLSDINIILNKSLAYTKREAGPSRVDPIAAANVDEDLDYRIAHRMKSAEGWRSFLTGHPDGPHAQSARAELEKLVPAGKAPVPAAAQAPVPIAGQASDVRPLDTKAPSEAASPAQPSPPSEVAKLATDEICKHDENGLQWLSNSPTSDEALRFLAELRCEKLRPEIFRLTEHLDYRDPSAIVATQSRSPKVAQAAAANRRAIEPRNKPRWRVASRSAQPRRRAARWAAPSLPPILMALFGETRRNSTAFQHIRVGGGPEVASGAGGVGASAASAGGGPGRRAMRESR